MATINLGSIKFNWKGAFNNSTAYAVDDVVSSGGNSYVCIQASQGNAVGNATAYWNIMSASGAEGGTSTLTTRGDLLTRGASALARLAKGTAGQVLGQGANDPAWVNGSSSTLTTQGDLLYRDGSGLQRLAKGTAGQHLLMNSGANAPQWTTQAAASSDYVKLGTASLSAATSLSIDNLFSSTYKFYEYRIRQLYNSTANQDIRFRVNVSGSAVNASHYRFVTSGARRTSGGTLGAVQEGGWNSTEIYLGANPPASDEFAYGIIRIYDPLGSTRTGMDFQMASHKNAEVNLRSGNGYYTQGAVVTGITLLTSGGNMTIAEVNLYGVK